MQSGFDTGFFCQGGRGEHIIYLHSLGLLEDLFVGVVRRSIAWYDECE